MARGLSIASVIDKNKVASDNVWLVLLKIEVRDEIGAVVETLFVVDNNENITFQGQVYEAMSFDINFEQEANTEPSMKVSVDDITGVIRAKMEDYNGGVGSTVTVMFVNASNLTGDPEVSEVFDVTGASAPDMTVEWTLGAENPLRFPYPYRKQYRDRCPWLYKGVRCGYTGAMPSCDYTKDGANGCRAHGNLPRFGGFPGLQNRM